MSIPAGELNARIEIQAYIDEPDAGGGRVKTWKTFAKVWAKWKHQNMFERLQAMQMEAGVNHRVIIRKRDDVSAVNRILYKGKAYQIVGVVNVAEMNEAMELQVTEGVAT